MALFSHKLARNSWRAHSPSALPRVRACGLVGVDSYLAVLLNSMCTLAAFTPILLSLGARIVAPSALLRMLGSTWMLACAIASAAIGLGVAMIAGRRLVSLEVDNQRVEAKLRRDCVLLEASPDAICAAHHPQSDGGPQREGRDGGDNPNARGVPAMSKSADAKARTLLPPAPQFRRIWFELNENYGALFRNFLGLNLWLDSFDQVMVLAPYVLVAPRVFADTRDCLLYTSPSPRDRTRSRMPSSA